MGCRPSQRSVGGTQPFLDGIRGPAALGVFVEHFLLPFWSTIFQAYGDTEEPSFPAQLPIIRLLYSGSPMVYILFVISGIALSLKPALLAQEHQWQQIYKIFESSAFRRGIRLSGPCVVASFTHMLMPCLYWCDVQADVDCNGPEEVKEETWLKQPQHLSGFWNHFAQWLNFC